jgi:hypothetical protein
MENGSSGRNATTPADPHLRRRAIAGAVITTLVGVISLLWFRGYLRGLEALATASPQLALQKLSPIRRILIALMLCSSTTLAGVLAYIALRIIATGQWPPPGWLVLWETPTRTGRQATAVVALLLILAVASLVFGITMVSWIWPEPGAQGGPPMREV